MFAITVFHTFELRYVTSYAFVIVTVYRLFSPHVFFQNLQQLTIHLEFIKTQLCLKRNILRHLNCTVFNSPANNKCEWGKNEARANISLFIVCNKKTFKTPLQIQNQEITESIVLKNFVLIIIIVFSLPYVYF